MGLLIVLSSAYTGDALECMVCHDGSIGPLINSSLFGSHIDVNITGGAGNLTSEDCIACHYSANTVVHLLPVSTYTCEDCHINGVLPAAPKVYNHTRNANISVNAFCGDCHNKTSNLFSYSANASAAHYGRNASFGLPTGEQYCIWCHQNSSTIYKDVMQNANNNRINNHTSGIINPGHPAGQPDCTTCHGQDKLHGATITKPAYDSGFCRSCHDNDRLKKNKHADTVECITCHADTATDIHNIKYLLQNGTYRSINANGCTDCHNFGLPAPYFQLPFASADCTTCHQSGLVKFSSAPKIPAPMEHSTNPYSGAMWNGSQPAYWSTSSQKSACNYCHGNTLHSSNAPGNISNIQAGNAQNQSITSTSFWCANCHYMGSASGNYSYNASSFSPVPPEIQNKTGLVPQKAGDGTNFFNHSLGNWSDNACLPCHSVNSPTTTAQFVHNVAAGGGGADCVSCHDVAASGAPPDKKIDILALNKSVHYGLNGGGSRACWACHGDGTAPTGHPAGYKSPRKCSSDNCHSLNQDYRAPMVYSHFRNASRNGNPGNVPNVNVTTGSNCEECHAISAIAEGNNVYSTASHYGSLELPDSINCIYCHLNEDNSKEWGSATLIHENRTNLSELDRERNKFTVKAGESFDLGNRFRLKVLEISTARDSALIELLKDNVLLDRSPVKIGNYTYEENLTIDDSIVKSTVIVLNITGIFNGDNISFIQFEGWRLKRVHTENKTTSCYLCHVYTRQRVKYRVIDRNEDTDDIFYSEELVNLTDKKEYNETDALRIIANLTDNDTLAGIGSGKRKTLFEGEVWNIAKDYSLLLKEITTKSDEAYLMLRVGNHSYEDIVKKGQVFEYSPRMNLDNRSRNITIFRARVVEMIQAKPENMVVLEEVVALSPDIKKIQEDQTLLGYNSSWLWENSTIIVGRIPENFHSPQLFDGADGGGDCLSCHGGLDEKRVSLLGKHENLNGGGNNACYACHGGTKDMQAHPAGYRTPRNCVSCHAALQDNYGAVYIGDEEHRKEKCEGCHVSNFHEITVYNILPSVDKLSLQKQENKTIIKASALAGYKMKVRGARYYIDSLAEKIAMQPVDGVFDSQTEEVYGEVDVSKISSGKHVIYVESMERDNKWSNPATLAVRLENGELKVDDEKKSSTFFIIPALGILVIVYLVITKIMGIDLMEKLKGVYRLHESIVKYINDIRRNRNR